MMKSEIARFRFIKNGAKDKGFALDHQQQGDQMATVTASTQILMDMRDQYDGLLAVAQNVSGAAYDFSRSIQEMASYMLETFGKLGNGDTEPGSSFSMLCKVQYEISKLLDVYAAHVSQTIIKPTEKQLEELESVEDIKERYEDKRELYNQIKLQNPKGRRKKGDAFEQRVMALQEQLNDKATLLDLRFQSLIHGRELSLIAQAARHQMAQAHLFGKGLKSLNAVESMVKQLSRDLHIDQTLSDGDIGLLWNASSYEMETELTRNDDEEEIIPSSPSLSQPVRTEVEERFLSSRPCGAGKLWGICSKSAPLLPSFHVTTRKSSVLPDMEKDVLLEKDVTAHALPSPSGPTAKLYNHATMNVTEAEVPHCSSHLSKSLRTRIGSADSVEEMHGLAGFSRMEAYKPHAMGTGEEEAPSMKEKRSSENAQRSPSPSHCHSTLYSEGLQPLSVSSYGQSTSMASFRYKQSIHEVDHLYKSGPVRQSALWVPTPLKASIHEVDRLYKSGPVRQSAPWVPTPLKVSPCGSPPLSHASPPVISELHKLPAPPITLPRTSACSYFSAPLGTKALASGSRKLAMVEKPIVLSPSALTLVKKSCSIPSPANFAGNRHHRRIDDSPVIESR